MRSTVRKTKATNGDAKGDDGTTSEPAKGHAKPTLGAAERAKINTETKGKRAFRLGIFFILLYNEV
ncbi:MULTISPECIES: hypothetical protein [Enterococcus]|uniref:hypothetical protein n=1 Tax=Enterococcus TaxID=1350 RepID=UPI0022E3204D|nr:MULTISPECIES: hypothetical protein [Enterococcus]